MKENSTCYLVFMDDSMKNKFGGGEYQMKNNNSDVQ